MFRRKDPEPPIEQAEPVEEPDIYDVPAPPRAGPGGFMNPAYSRWEMLQAERRVRVARGRPLGKTAVERAVEGIDAQIATAEVAVQDAARAKSAIERRLSEASGTGNTFGPGGRVDRKHPNVRDVHSLERDLRVATVVLTDAKEASSRLRRQRNDVGTVDRMTTMTRELSPGRRYSFNTARYVDGKYIPGDGS